MADEHPLKPFYSVLVLAFVCSALVAGAAVGLRPYQEANRTLDRQKHILYASGLFEPGKTMEEMFAPITTKIIELSTGRIVGRQEIDPASYNQLKAALDEEMGNPLPPEADIARLRRVEKYSLIYEVMENDQVSQYILPVRGKGLWSTMYAFVAIDGDLSTIKGISFYEHGETPGLGGEVENPRWQQGWQNKKVYDENGKLRFSVVKGKSDGQFQVDGLSGATLTTKGVDNLMRFWFGEHGFEPFITTMRNRMQRGNNG